MFDHWTGQPKDPLLSPNAYQCNRTLDSYSGQTGLCRPLERNNQCFHHKSPSYRHRIGYL